MKYEWYLGPALDEDAPLLHTHTHTHRDALTKRSPLYLKQEQTREKLHTTEHLHGDENLDMKMYFIVFKKDGT